jgi:7-carboxy-7-deazaguanine synthase
MNKPLTVLETFTSIQGEGAAMGVPVVFVRFAGCNLHCPWCDTKQSWLNKQEVDFTKPEVYVPASHLPDGVKEKSAEVLVAELVKHYGLGKEIKNVVLTGGEPLYQEGIADLVTRLHKTGDVTVAVETNGMFATKDLGIDWVTISPKPPKFMVHCFCVPDEIKFVIDKHISWEDDILPIIQQFPTTPVWLQPEGGEMLDSASRAYRMVMAYGDVHVRLGCQMHKIFDLR